MLYGNVLITGGTGTLGYALAERITVEQWPCRVTIVSRSPEKQQLMRRKFPRFNYALCDIRDLPGLTRIFYGHDIVIHAAAQKHIPEAEHQPHDCYAVNVQGSLNIIEAASWTHVERVIAISTDKVCHPVNVYGCSKMMMERALQQYALLYQGIKINICRYGNVLGSTGSVLEVWADAVKRGDPCKITDPHMTRFWLSSQQAVSLILYALDQPSGTITIPKLPSLSMGNLLRYVHGSVHKDVVGLRPGEKLHEELLTPEESPYAELRDGYYHLYPTTSKPVYETMLHGYTSNIARELSRDELRAMLNLETA